MALSEWPIEELDEKSRLADLKRPPRPHTPDRLDADDGKTCFLSSKNSTEDIAIKMAPS